MNENDEFGLITKIWGPHLWKSLHCISFGYPKRPTPDQKNGYKLFFESLAYVLPCQYCRDSYSYFIKSEPTILTDSVFDNRDNLTMWVYKLHQRVNQKLDVDYGVSFDQVAKKYESFRIKCSAKTLDPSQCVLSKNDKSSAYINEFIVDCPIVPIEIVEKLTEYAKKRGVLFDKLKTYVNMTENEKLERNVRCNEIINRMKLMGLSSVELEGEYYGLPTVYELKLLSMLCSNLGKSEILALSDKINKTYDHKNKNKYKLMKKTQI